MCSIYGVKYILVCTYFIKIPFLNLILILFVNQGKFDLLEMLRTLFQEATIIAKKIMKRIKNVFFNI